MIVDDEVELMTALCEMLSGQGYLTAGFRSGEEALVVLKDREFDLLLTDMMMPGMNGIELIRNAIEIDPNLIGIIMTGHGTVQSAVEAMKTGAFDYILKPFKLGELMPLLTRAMQVRNLRLENMQLKETVAIHELGKAISFSSDLSSILNKIADTALQQCSADEVSIMLPTRDGSELYVAVVRGGHTENIGTHVSIEHGIAGWVARNRELVVLRGEVKDPRMAPIKPRTDIHTAVCMPMLSGGKLMGVLNVNVTKAHRAFTLGQVNALTILVSIIAPILENAWLYIKIREEEEKYRSIFNNSIEGIYQRSPEGRIIAANPAFARMLGYDTPEDLMASITDYIHQVYANPTRADEFIQIMESNGSVRNFEFQARQKNGRSIWLSANGIAVRSEDGKLRHYEGLLQDITERKQAETRTRLVRGILEMLNSSNNDITDLIHDILSMLKEQADIEAVGIRLKEGEDFPFFMTDGFTNHFVDAENHLCAYDKTGEIIRDAQGKPILECMCGNILKGRIDPSLPFFTKGGSFWTNSTTKLLASTSPEDRQSRTRNRCNGEGYESVALIPLQSDGNTFGILQFNDSRQGIFTPERIHFFEGLAASIGIAIGRKRSIEALRDSELKYRTHFENVMDVIYSTDGDLRFIEISPSAEKVFGYRPDELIGRSIGELNLASTETVEKIASDIERVLSRKEYVSEVYEFLNKDGTGRFCEVSSSFLPRHGNTPMAICVARDITERKQAEEWLLRERSIVDRIMKTSPAGITVVDRDGSIVFANQRAQEIFRLETDKITKLTYHAPQWNITDFEGKPLPKENLPFHQVMSSGHPVYGVRHTIVTNAGERVYLSINGAPLFDEEGNIKEVVFTIDDITKQRRAEEKISESMEKLRQSINDTTRAMALVVETRDPYTAGHQSRVAELAHAIACELDLSGDQTDGLRMASTIHDIGKISVPAELLSKPTRLSDIEFSLIKVHPQSGYDILKDIQFPWPIARIILEHHERMNGSGYPNGLTGDKLLIESRILAVADVVESMASHRPYRPALGIGAALDEINKNKVVLYDPAVVDACLRLFAEKRFELAS